MPNIMFVILLVFWFVWIIAGTQSLLRFGESLGGEHCFSDTTKQFLGTSVRKYDISY